MLLPNALLTGCFATLFLECDKAGEHVLIVLPKLEKWPRTVPSRVAEYLREKGPEVTVFPLERSLNFYQFPR